MAHLLADTIQATAFGGHSIQAMVHFFEDAPWLTFWQTLYTGHASPFGGHSIQAMAHLLADTQYRRCLTFWQTLNTGDGSLYHSLLLLPQPSFI